MIEYHDTQIMRTPLQMRDCYCLYMHRIAQSTDIFYIGVCKFDQVFKCPDAQANTHWNSSVTEDTIVQTNIVATSASLMELHSLQSKLVKEHRPICNIKGYRQAGRTIITCTQGPNAGRTYATVTEAAQKNGLAQPTLSSHLNGRPGYETVRGMKFKRGV